MTCLASHSDRELGWDSKPGLPDTHPLLRALILPKRPELLSSSCGRPWGKACRQCPRRAQAEGGQQLGHVVKGVESAVSSCQADTPWICDFGPVT